MREFANPGRYGPQVLNELDDLRRRGEHCTILLIPNHAYGTVSGRVSFVSAGGVNIILDGLLGDDGPVQELRWTIPIESIVAVGQANIHEPDIEIPQGKALSEIDPTDVPDTIPEPGTYLASE